jgi:hypothetical protein
MDYHDQGPPLPGAALSDMGPPVVESRVSGDSRSKSRRSGKPQKTAECPAITPPNGNGFELRLSSDRHSLAGGRSLSPHFICMRADPHIWPLWRKWSCPGLVDSEQLRCAPVEIPGCRGATCHAAPLRQMTARVATTVFFMALPPEMTISHSGSLRAACRAAPCSSSPSSSAGSSGSFRHNRRTGSRPSCRRLSSP